MTRITHLLTSGLTIGTITYAITQEPNVAVITGIVGGLAGIVPDLDIVLQPGNYVAKHYRYALLAFPMGALAMLITALVAQGKLKHRGFSHSLLGLLSFTLGNVLMFVGIVLYLKTYAHISVQFSQEFLYYSIIYVVISTAGYLIHLLTDACTVSGVPLLYPFKKRNYRLPLPPVRTGSISEGIFLITFLFIEGIVLYSLLNK